MSLVKEILHRMRIARREPKVNSDNDDWRKRRLDVLQKPTEKVVASQIHKDLDKQSLAYVARATRVLIPVAGINAVRRKVIKSIEDDLGRASKKGTRAVEDMIQEALNTPEYMALLNDLGMDETHIRVLQKEICRA